MSLINQMLRDLESRRATPAPAGVAPLALAAQRAADSGAPVAPQRHDGRTDGAQRGLIAAIVLLAVLLGLLLWTSQPPWRERPAPAAAVAAGPVLSVPVVEMAVQPAAPAEPVESVEPVVPTEPVESVEPVVPTEPAEAVEPHEPIAAPEPAAQPAEPLVAPTPTTPPTPNPSTPSNQQPALSTEPSTPSTKHSAPSTPELLVTKHLRPLDDEHRAQQALRHGVGLLGKGRQAEAEQALREALHFDPRLARARETLAALYLNSGRLTEAQALLAEGLRLTPRAAGLAQLHARLLAEQGDLATALTVLQRASPPLTENPDYHALLAALYQRAGQHASAAWVYRQLLAQDGRRATWWLGLGISLEALDDIAPALEAYLKAHQLGVGLSPQVLDYVGSRIGALAPRVEALKPSAGAED